MVLPQNSTWGFIRLTSSSERLLKFSLRIWKTEQRKLGQDKPVYTDCGWNHQPGTCPDAGDRGAVGKAGHGRLRRGKSCERVIHIWTSGGLTAQLSSPQQADSKPGELWRWPARCVEGRGLGNYSALTQMRKFRKYLLSSVENKNIWNQKIIDLLSACISACVYHAGPLLPVCKVEWWSSFNHRGWRGHSMANGCVWFEAWSS